MVRENIAVAVAEAGRAAKGERGSIGRRIGLGGGREAPRVLLGPALAGGTPGENRV